MKQPVSISPDGVKYPLPKAKDYNDEIARMKIVAEQRALGREIVVVIGVGFVGAVMAAVIADTTDRKTGKPTKFVIGMQRPSTRSFWKIQHQSRASPGGSRRPAGGAHHWPVRERKANPDSHLYP